MTNNDNLFVKKLEKEINVDKPEEPAIESQDNLRAAMASSGKYLGNTLRRLAAL